MTVETRRIIAKWVIVALFTAIVAFVVCLVTGCAVPVVPAAVASRTIAYDGNDQNAGVLVVWPGKGALLTEAKKAEYDALVDVYGRGTVGHPLVPPVIKGAGLTALRGTEQGFPLHDVVWLIDAQHLTDFLLFKGWQRQSRTPL